MIVEQASIRRESPASSRLRPIASTSIDQVEEWHDVLERLTSWTIVVDFRDAVLRGDYPPGSQLSEVALAESLGVSRGTVREALRTLAESGLVEVFPHRGAFVPALTIQRAKEIYSLRMVLEPFAARLAYETGGWMRGSRGRPSVSARGGG
jgi:DNA-binding GntR family transcriptional regulator